MRPEIISGLSAIGFAIGSWAVSIVFPHVDPAIAQWMLWLAIGLLVVAGALRLWGLKKPDGFGGTAITQTTNGPNSPTFGTVNGDVTITHGSPTEGGERQGTGSIQRSRQNRAMPDMTLDKVVERVTKRIGAPPDETEQGIAHFIIDGVVNRPLSTWGRRAVGKPVMPIWKEAWERGDFSHVKGTLRYRHPDNPTSVLIWSDIQFNYAEVKRWVRPDLGPNGWMAGDI